MGRLRFSKKVRVLGPDLQRKITFFSSLGFGLVCGLITLHAEDPAELLGAGLPRRLNSTEATDFYPDDLLLNKPYFDEPIGRKFLALFHVVGIAYCVLGLNTVCDVYFAGAIDILCDTWNLTPDVAGATWMAAGGSAPEFFTSMIGATIAQNDIGFGTIVGSAVFNVLFVVGLCGWVAKGNIDLTWWPLFRDCSYYIVSLGVLAAFVSDQYVKPWEAGILFGMYILYVLFMLVNRPLNVWAYQMTGTPLNKELRDYVEEKQKASSKVEPMEAVEEAVPAAKQADEPPKPAKDNYMEPDKVVVKSTPIDDDDGNEPEDLAGKDKDDKNMSKDNGKDAGGDGDDDEDDDEPDDFMEIPEGIVGKVIWGLCLIVYIPMYLTLPWPSKGSKFYMVTFFLSLLWIAAFSFPLVWLTETVAAVIGIPTIISGLTFLAAATSIPDAVSSMAVARKGQADMAVSSSVGSNIFDILVGLPVPWMVKCGIEASNPSFKGIFIRSPFLMFYTCLLLGMVFGTVISIMLSKWKLNKFLGGCMAVLYILFIIACVVIEETQPAALMTNPP
ncbi:SLC24A1 [Symbiodinium pilosum]|uniref:SLC24A1 protein n=1 Tax=Symbiodinium pilosum TaxID=2952 RepID=A0A812IV26_SYMPI|nr:SLC24A1 [Symbiodinium pilosum]